MHTNSVVAVTAETGRLLRILVTLSRLVCLLALVEPQVKRKSEILARAVRFMTAADIVHRYFRDVLSQRHFVVVWPIHGGSTSIKAITQTRKISIRSIGADIEVLRRAMLEIVTAIGSGAVHSPMLEASALMAQIVSAVLTLDKSDSDFPEQPIGNNFADVLLSEWSKKLQFRQSVRGPRSVDCDPCFVRGESVLKEGQPLPGDNVIENCPCYWHESAREAAASDLCSLSIIEYDGLPFEFYFDFVRQAYDEARHAVFYKGYAVGLMSDYLRMYPDSKWAQQISDYLETGTGLQIPKEGCFYEAFWNASLEERIFLMHHDSEATGLQNFASKIALAEENEAMEFKEALHFDQRDEIAHTRLGAKWLRFLIPDARERKLFLEEAATLRGFLLFTSVAASNGKFLSDQIRETFTVQEVLCAGP